MSVVATERAAGKCQLCMNCDKTHDPMIGRETVSSSGDLYQRIEIATATPQNLRICRTYVSVERFLPFQVLMHPANTPVPVRLWRR